MYKCSVMKRRIVYNFCFFTILVCVVWGGCGRTKEVVNVPPKPPTSESVLTKATGDTDEYFEGWGEAYGSRVRKGKLHILALGNAQNVIRQKIRHAYQGMIKTVLEANGNNVGTDILTKMESCGRQFINAIIGDTREIGLPKFSAVDERGNVSCEVIVRVYRKEVINRVASYLFKDEKIKELVEAEFLREVMERYFGK